MLVNRESRHPLYENAPFSVNGTRVAKTSSDFKERLRPPQEACDLPEAKMLAAEAVKTIAGSTSAPETLDEVRYR
ncbi:hypothetical protein GCM10023156_23060 [Novipirellula rosea]|uniref:Uncharacterized protein n=1 Tax=Novipirellula rosea TaxID=1031540 RepID=A0ABP8MQS2_9BACT